MITSDSWLIEIFHRDKIFSNYCFSWLITTLLAHKLKLSSREEYERGREMGKCIAPEMNVINSEIFRTKASSLQSFFVRCTRNHRRSIALEMNLMGRESERVSERSEIMFIAYKQER